jgi:hypothetical protein
MLLYFGSLTILHAPEGFVCDLGHTCSGGTHVRVRRAMLASVANLAVRSNTGRESEKARK